MDNVLITGGAGFIGSRLVDRLVASGAQVSVLDCLLDQVHGTIPTYKPGPTAAFFKERIEDRAAVARVLNTTRPDTIFHLAADTGTGQSMECPWRYCDVNVSGTAGLLEAVRDTGLNPTIILASSRSIYGEGAYTDEQGQVHVPPPRSAKALEAGRFDISPNGRWSPKATGESTPVRPASVYASTKLMQEHLVQQVCELHGWPYRILRFQNVYGDGQSLKNPYTGVLSVFARRLILGEGIEVFEDGEITRDFVYVDDVVEALMNASSEELGSQLLLNIGSGQPATILGVAEIMLDLLSLPHSKMTVTGAFRVGDVRHAVADISEAQRTLDWRPSVSLPDGLDRLLRWTKVELTAEKQAVQTA